MMRMKNCNWLLVLPILACGKSNVTGPDIESTPEPRVILQPLPEVPVDRIFGYYAYASSQAGCGWTNFTIMSVNSQSVEDAREKALAARECNQVVSYIPVGPWKHWEDTFKPIAQAFADAGVLHSVYVADEPLANPVNNPNHVSYNDLAQRIADVHAAGFKAMFTEQGGGIDKPHPAVDYYGLDWYDVQLRWVRYTLQRHPEINILVPPAYMPYVGMSPLNGNGTPNQNAWVEMARQQKVGVVFWMWPTIGPWTGVEDLPEVQQQHKILWRK